MSNFSDFPKIGENRPILRIEQDIRSIRSSLNTLLIDTQALKSDIAEIKEILKEKEQSKNISGGWWIY
tara:strand:- start:354 stop:557 length:204 start_codon:yes stop_codon:yes gene_type:complete